MPSHQAEQSATAFQLAAALEQYETGVEQLLARGHDPELHAAMTRQLEPMRLYVGALPDMSVAWVALLITRFELTLALWNAGRSGADARVRVTHDEHKEAIAMLRRRCTRMLVRR